MAKHSQTNGTVRVLGLLVVIAGAILIVAGAGTVRRGQQYPGGPEDHRRRRRRPLRRPAGDPAVAGVRAGQRHRQARERDRRRKTYAELPQDDPNRNTVMTASFLQASLFTSVVAFGVAFMAVGMGIVFVLIGIALRRVARPVVVLPATAKPAEPVAVAPPAEQSV